MSQIKIDMRREENPKLNLQAKLSRAIGKWKGCSVTEAKKKMYSLSLEGLLLHVIHQE